MIVELGADDSNWHPEKRAVASSRSRRPEEATKEDFDRVGEELAQLIQLLNSDNKPSED